MSGLSRRDLLRGRFFRREETPPTESEAAADGTGEVPTPSVETAPEPPPAAPLPPWEVESAAPSPKSPIAQVPPWEVAPVDTAAPPTIETRRARALSLERAGPGRRMVFSIQHNLCLAWRNVPCTVCRERCAAPHAITWSEGRPTIEADHCTSCGDCVAVCPAPIMAIRMHLPPRTP